MMFTTPDAERTLLFARTLLLSGLFGACLLGCSASGNADGSTATGGATNAGGNGGAGGSLSTGGSVGAGGSVATGGSLASGGSLATVTGGVPASGGVVTGGILNAGGATGAGGLPATGGVVATGGIVSTGGTTVTDAAVATGGIASSGGTRAAGGTVLTGGTRPTGGASATGGQTGSGGTSGTGGSTASGGATTVTGPCDIYASGNSPCVAAHSTVRALAGAYNGNLYQVKRASDNTTKDIAVLTPGGFANAAAQDAFCAGTTCTISTIYDQSGKANHLTKAPAGGAKNTPDNEADASALKLTVGGHSVYGVHIPAGVGYRNDKTSGIAVKDEPESMYMITSGNTYNDKCCFDYGNAETNNKDNGAGTMEAIYFGNCKSWGKGSGAGPWVMADLENGLFAGKDFGPTTSNTPLTSTYVTAMVIGRSGTFTIKGGNSQSGTLTTMYDGSRPTMGGYNPMNKEGAVILGIGGDNSNSAQGNFFEGCMTSGASTTATDDAIQANIVAAGYGR